jgi:diguanylate cyclase (GGDEF)-like protein
MKRTLFSLTAKLAAIHAMLAASLLALVAVAWDHLPSTEDVALVAQLGRAQQVTQHADMLHDALHSDVLAALLESDRSAATTDRLLNTVRNDANEFRQEILRISSMPLPTSLEPNLINTRDVGGRYVSQAEQMVQLAVDDSPLVQARKREFDVLFEGAKTALAEQTTAIEKQLTTANAAAKQAVTDARRWLLVAATVTVIGGWFVIALIARSIRKSLIKVSATASAVAAGDLTRRSDLRGSDEVGQISDSVNQMADALSNMIERMRTDANHSAFGAQLASALDMADSEQQASAVVEHAMGQISPKHAMELLMADSSEAHLERAAQHPTAGAAGCGVDSPYSCIAVRRGHAVHFTDSEALDACPKLRGRRQESVSATCVPVSFMGRALGVVHACGPTNSPLSDDAKDRLKVLGAQAGARIGTVRSFERTQIQASTDALTGLANRRAAEARMRLEMSSGQPFALIMADLDRFKLLNDTHGHRAGDEALRLFADVARDSLRPQDFACRWGGEEFCFFLSNSDTERAMQWTDRLRARLAHMLTRRSVPVFTASFGVIDSKQNMPLDSMLSAADMALYRAKSSGRNRSVAALQEDGDDLARQVRESEQTATISVRMLADAG